MTTVVVTGAGGYVGGRLVEALAAAGITPIPIVGTRRPWLGAGQRVVNLLDTPSSLVETLEGADALVHLAGANEVAAARDPDAALCSTVVAGRHVAEAVQQSGIARLVYVSTVHVYGAAMVPGALLDEVTLPAPRAPYAIARLAVEHALAASDADLVILRLTNSIGAPADGRVDRWSLLANDLCQQAVARRSLELRSSGRQWRDFCALADVCTWIGSSCDTQQVAAGTYNAGSGVPMTVLDLATTVQRRAEAMLGEHVPLLVPDHDGPVPVSYRVDVARARAAGMMSERSLESAVDETLRFCASRREEVAP